MLKKLGRLLAAPVAFLVAACEEGPATVASAIRSPATWSTMTYATAKGPMLIEFHGRPFGLDPKSYGPAAAEAMSNPLPQRPFAFTTDPSAAVSGISVVMMFNPGKEDMEGVCAGQTETGEAQRERVTASAVFCNKENRLASVTGWVLPKHQGPEDERFRQFLRQMMRELFGNPP